MWRDVPMKVSQIDEKCPSYLISWILRMKLEGGKVDMPLRAALSLSLSMFDKQPQMVYAAAARMTLRIVCRLRLAATAGRSGSIEAWIYV